MIKFGVTRRPNTRTHTHTHIQLMFDYDWITCTYITYNNKKKGKRDEHNQTGGGNGIDGVDQTEWETTRPDQTCSAYVIRQLHWRSILDLFFFWSGGTEMYASNQTGTDQDRLSLLPQKKRIEEFHKLFNGAVTPAPSPSQLPQWTGEKDREIHFFTLYHIGGFNLNVYWRKS